MISFQTDSQHDTPSQIRRSRIKIIFLLDITNDKKEVTVPNGRALEVLSTQLQLKQTGPGETWLAFPTDEMGYRPESESFIPLVRFGVALRPVKRTRRVAKKVPARKATAKK